MHALALLIYDPFRFINSIYNEATNVLYLYFTKGWNINGYVLLATTLKLEM